MYGGVTPKIVTAMQFVTLLDGFASRPMGILH